MPGLAPALVTYALVVLMLVGAYAADNQPARWVLKPVASIAFLALAVAGGRLDSGPIGWWLFAGLCCGALGDVWLLSRQRRWFLAGLVAFLANHVAYCIAFVQLGVRPVWVSIALLPLGLAAWGVWRWVGPHTGRLAVPVAAYIAVITTMVALAAGVGEARWMVAAGLFFLSDLAVARDRFIHASPRNKMVGLPLYYVSQALFALVVIH